MSGVHIRGYGVVSAHGAGVDVLVDALRARRVVFAPLANPPVPALAGLRVSALPSGSFRFDDEGVHDVVMTAVDEALRRAGIAAPLGDCAVLCGSSMLALAERNYLRLRQESGGRRPPMQHAGHLATRIAQTLGARGPALTFSTSCSSSANALLVARDLILRGQVTRALVLGVEALGMVTLSGFQSLMILDPEGCRPFDAERAGLQLGEGVAALLLEAQGDGPVFLGGANLCDIHHVTSASPDGSGMARCMRAALDATGIGTVDIVAIKAHGTASPDSDAAEAAAMRSVFDASLPPFTVIKRYTGHTLAACGAIETVAFLAALKAGFVPATAGFSNVDPELGVAPATEVAPARAGDYLLNYFGFGGNYASLVMRHD